MTQEKPAPFLIDASVWCASVDEDDPHCDAAAAVISRNAVLALDLTLYEVANVAVRTWGEPARAEELVAAVLRTGSRPPVPVTETIMHRAIRLAELHGITVYDAAYAAVADEQRMQLVSCDVRDLVSNGLAVLPEDVVADAS